MIWLQHHTLTARQVLACAIVLTPAGTLVSAQSGAVGAGLPASRQVRAVRVSGAAPQIDGRLDDAVWRSGAAWTSGFTQREPTEGAQAVENTDVAFYYDDDALYVAARMHSANPARIRALVSRRDREETSEQIVVSLDTQHDRLTAYTFAITAAGVRLDYYQSADFETRREYTYDPVWEGRSYIDSTGWTAELRIPFTQLRFSTQHRQTWGVNLVRLTPATNSRDYWVLVNRNDTGWASRMGELVGIEGIRPSRRIEFAPYVASDATVASQVDRANPFAKRLDNAYRVGGDVKVGLGPSFTLDATLNPDFGQVEADPAEVNLSGFETFFSERRPFFLEGTQLLNGRGNFYSRRIGAPPPGFGGGTFRDAPINTTILGAAKVTGRLRSGLSIAALTAVTDGERARNFDSVTRAFGSAIVAPRTSYALVSTQREFWKNSSVFNVVLTAVNRDLESSSALTSQLARSAYSGVGDVRVRWAAGKYDLVSAVGFSHLRGDSLAILGQQRSNRRFFQRPDAGHVEVDPSQTTLSGFNALIGHSKLAGKHWLWDIDALMESPGLELNDVGRLGSADNQLLLANLVYRETTPGRYLRAYNFQLQSANGWNFDGDRVESTLLGRASTTLQNLWSAGIGAEYASRALSDALSRGGPLMGTPRSLTLSANVNSNATSRNRWRANMSTGKDEAGGWFVQPSLTSTARLGSRLELSVDPRASAAQSPRQYVTTRSDGTAATFGRRYVFAGVRRSEIALRLRANYALTPRTTIETYFEPFASSGRFESFGEMAAPRALALRTYGRDGTTITSPNANGERTVTDGAVSFLIPDLDFNVRSFRSNVVLRSEWRLGSTLFLVWQQNRSGRDAIGSVVQAADLIDALRAQGTNYLAVKVSYWLPIR